MVNFYFCVGCRQVHYDNDYCEKDGDLIIYNHGKFFESVEDFKNKLKDASSTLNEQEVIMRKLVKDRTQEEHLSLIKNRYDGSVRDYLLSMGAFKEVKIGCGKPTEFKHGYEKIVPWLCGEGQPDYKEPFLCKECREDSLCECGHHTNEHSHPYPIKIDKDNLECDVCDCKKFREDSLSAPNDEVLTHIAKRINDCYSHLLFLKSNIKRKNWVEGSRQRLDELLLIWSEFSDMSFIGVCTHFGVNYDDVNTKEITEDSE